MPIATPPVPADATLARGDRALCAPKSHSEPTIEGHLNQLGRAAAGSKFHSEPIFEGPRGRVGRAAAGRKLHSEPIFERGPERLAKLHSERLAKLHSEPISSRRFRSGGAWLAAALCALLAACGDTGGDASAGGTGYALGSVVIDADGNRTTYVQVVDSLDGPFTNADAIEMPGNGVVMARGQDIFVGLAEEPTWVKYSVDASGTITEAGRLSLLNAGATYVDYGNAIVDDTTAVSVLSGAAKAIVWNPQTMTIVGEIDLSHLVREGWELEVWTTTARDGRVYVPGRWADWQGGRIFAGVSMTILDPKAMRVLAHVEDDRCASGGRAVFDADGTLYVMGDGRTYSIQMFANASGGTAPANCLLRIKPGTLAFDPAFYVAIPSLTGGPEAIGELEAARDGSGLAFAKMFHRDHLPPGVEPVDFDFWSVPAHKLWRIELGDTPRAREVDGVPFAAIGFGSSAMDGKLYAGESPDGSFTEVYEVDPETNRAAIRFRMDGYFYGLYRLTR